MPDTTLSGIAADKVAGTEYDIINQSINQSINHVVDVLPQSGRRPWMLVLLMYALISQVRPDNNYESTC